MKYLDGQQLETLTSYIRIGASDASRALSKWLGREVRVSAEQLQQVPLETAAEQLGPADEIACACCMRVKGGISGQLLLGFDDASGLILCETLLTSETLTSATWTSATLTSEAYSMDWDELKISSVMETTNIVGCAFLNSLSSIFPTSNAIHDLDENSLDPTWVPTPPVFVRDYAAAIMQFALMDQACEFDTMLVAEIQFTIDDLPIAWRMLLIPDAKVLDRLARTLL